LSCAAQTFAEVLIASMANILSTRIFPDLKKKPKKDQSEMVVIVTLTVSEIPIHKAKISSIRKTCNQSDAIIPN